MTLREAIALLKEAGVPDYSYDARTIFERIGGVRRADLVFADIPASEAVESAILRRSEREPLQYILGVTDFYRESYEISSDCLIPRQETELLVDLAVKLMPKGERFLDLCTGSGCIAISTLANTVDTVATAVDISEAALKIAERNSLKNGVRERIDLLCADVTGTAVPGDFFAVLSNPPYVTDRAFEDLEPEIGHEPRIAFLGGGEDGADFYRRITELYRDRIKEGGFILYEIGFDQGDVLRKIAEKNRMSCEIKKDYSGTDRLALLRKSSAT